MLIRSETPSDHAAVHDLVVAAFGRDNEAVLVDRLRMRPDFIPDLSLVAEIDGTIVGHVLFGPMWIDSPDGPIDAIGLAPVAVLPEHQRRGVGSALIRHGLDRCRELGHRLVIVIGHAGYYPRFGFSSARAFGHAAPLPIDDKHFMALELVPGAFQGVTGVIRYPPEFADT